AAEAAFARTLLASDLRVEDGDILPAFDLQRVGEAHDVDRVAAAAGRLAADRAVAAHVGIGRRRLDGETDRAAMAGALEAHRFIPPQRPRGCGGCARPWIRSS